MQLSDGVSMDGDRWTMIMEMEMMEETMVVAGVVVVDVERDEEERSSCWPLW